MRRLIIRPGAIGDCILAFPAMQHLADAEYTEFWVPAPVVPLIQFGDQARALSATGLDLMGVGDLATNPKLAGHLRSFDHVVSWYGANRPEFRTAMRSLGVACDFYPALPQAEYSGHAVDFFAEQTGAPSGLTPRIRIKPSGPRKAAVIHPFSGSKRKNWPMELFRELAASLSLQVDWCAGPEELLPEANRFDNLAELGSWISGARVYVGNDSGITHLAAATGVPVVAIFLTTPDQVWAPRGDNVTVLRNPTLEQVKASFMPRASSRA